MNGLIYYACSIDDALWSIQWGMRNGIDPFVAIQKYRERFND